VGGSWLAPVDVIEEKKWHIISELAAKAIADAK
jgi:2-keto-3-deoxy-6-phosphogluconate aldolase